MSEAYEVRAGNSITIYPIIEGTSSEPFFSIAPPSGAYMDSAGVRKFCGAVGAVPPSGLELGLARLAKDLPQNVQAVLDQTYFRLRVPILYGIKSVRGKKAGFLLVGSNLPRDSDVFAEMVGRYLDQPDSAIKKAYRLVLKTNDRLVKRIVEYARDNKREFACLEQNETLLALRDTKGNRLQSAKSQLLFVENGVIRAMYDDKPEVHEEFARDTFGKNDLYLWQLITQDLINLGLQKGEFELCLSGVGGRGYDVNFVYALDDFFNHTGALPVVHVGARKFPLETKVRARVK